MRVERAAIATVMLLVLGGSARADGGPIVDAPASEPICTLVEASAKLQGLPVSFLTRLIWQESRFQADVVSPAGARGIAQFMPDTATAQGLADPFDPEQAIPKAAELLAQFKDQFGNLGLAAAAYNGGPARIAHWVASGGGLPDETRAFVLAITGHTIEEWSADGAAAKAGEAALPKTTCPEEISYVRNSSPAAAASSVLTAPWGVQISGAYSKAAALAAYQRARSRYASLLGAIEPMVIAGRMRGRGYAAFYRVRAPAASRAEGSALCAKILQSGGACEVLRN